MFSLFCVVRCVCVCVSYMSSRILLPACMHVVRARSNACQFHSVK